MTPDLDEDRLPLLKRPVWTWEVPTYFFVGGAAGTAAVIAFLAAFRADFDLVAAHARWIAAGGAAIAPLLLISDLGRPARFLNMLRVFKLQSAMSVGAWTLVVFSGAAVTSLATHLLTAPPPWLDVIGWVAAAVAAITGLVLATYTGVLIGVTVIPVWSAYVRVLPVLFGLSGLGTAVSLLELAGDRQLALNAMGLGVAAAETVLLLVAGPRRDDPDSAPLREGRSGALVRAGSRLVGPVSLLVRALALQTPLVRPIAAIVMILGAALTRFGWVAAGRVSAQDLKSPLR